MSPACFELHRQIDGLIYRFERHTGPHGRVGFKRTDGEHWIFRHERLGWIAGHWDSDEVFGRPWDQAQVQPEAAPPEGIWVSRKGPKSYVYELIYL
ncbi:hypothetical protein IQ782_15655 [Salipiger pacificus]|uniref:Uncharacterized protein n=2 Tax=Salipiger mangrovisoli TaxID=2865933 RepID=A0ABR9X3X4_9RHOB|nr:hypothetical protein [Salipiger mangrovisoli]